MKRQSIPTKATAQAMLLTTVVLFSPGFVQSVTLKAAPSVTVRICQTATTLRGGAVGTAQPTEQLGYPGTMYPQGAAWSLKKAPPKKSLSFLPIPQDKTAAAWILNLIELTHWASFPLGFYVAHYIYENGHHIETVLDSSQTRLFCIMLGLLCQVFGSGISGGIRHLYEGWQIAPFRNPLQSSPGGQKVPVEEFNNAWLRSVSYQMLFTFQVLGLGLFTMGEIGVNPWTQALVGVSMAVALLGPKEPRLGMTRMVNGQQRPVLPISLSLAVVFAINLAVNMFANAQLFCVAIESSIITFVGGAEIPACLLSIVPTLLIAASVAMEGCFAETSFNQWHHFTASLTLLGGLASTLVLHQRLLASIFQG